MTVYIDQYEYGRQYYVYEPAGFMDWNPLFTFAGLVVLLAMARMVTGSWFWEPYLPKPKEKEKPIAPTVPYEEKMRLREADLKAQGRDIAREAGVEFTRLDVDWPSSGKMWFRTPAGKDILAADLDELKWKMAVV